MRIVVFYLTIILSFSVLAAGENNNDKSKEKSEYYRKLNLARAYERGTVLKKDESCEKLELYRAGSIGIFGEESKRGESICRVELWNILR